MHAEPAAAPAAPAVQGPEADEESAAREEQYGAPKGEPGKWASCIRVVDPATLQARPKFCSAAFPTQGPFVLGPEFPGRSPGVFSE